MADFRAGVRDRDGVAIIDLAGDLTGRSAEDLMRAHELAVGGDPHALVLVFTDTEYINSSGIAVLVTVLSAAWRAHRPVRAVGLTEHYRHVFELTRLSDFMDFYVTEDAAVAGVTAAREATR